MASEVCMDVSGAVVEVRLVTNSEAPFIEDIGGCRLDASLGGKPPSVLITLLTHEPDAAALRRIAEAFMCGVAGLIEPGLGVRGQFYGNHTSNSATVVLNNITPAADASMSDAILLAYKHALTTTTSPVYQRVVHDVLFLPSGHTVRYEGRVGKWPV